MSADLAARVGGAVDRERLVDTACELVAIPSATGAEQACAEHLAGQLTDLGLETQLQEIEPGRANAVGRWRGTGGGPSLMFNGHLDTSYSGDEDWLTGPGYKPEPQVRDGAVVGLGIMNMKGAVACYVEALRALAQAGLRLRGDVVVAGVAGEIEKTQWGDEFRGAQYRGYGAGTRHLATHGVVTDACILGEPTEERLVLSHYGTVWGRISTAGPFVHTAFAGGRAEENSIVRLHRILDAILAWIPDWERQASYRGRPGVVNLGAVRGGFPWRVSRTPHRTDLFLDLRVAPDQSPRDAVAVFERLVASLAERHPDYGITSEVYVTVPGVELDEDHPLAAAIDTAHQAVTGAVPERDHVLWGSDASTLSRYGVACANYGPISSALPGPEGETVPIDSLVRMATTYALTACRFCGVV